jgi:hypothetical protein
MATITIPKNLIKEDLVIIPRREWDRVLRIARKEGYSEFDQNLNKIIKEVKEGKVIGPFSSVKSLKNSLEK